MRATRGPLLADDAMAVLAEEGRAIEYQSFERSQLAAAGLWHPAPVVAMLEARQFRLVVLREPGTPLCKERWGREVLDVIARRYRPLRRAGDFVVYGPQMAAGAITLPGK